jgi:histone chaperone ASF1
VPGENGESSAAAATGGDAEMMGGIEETAEPAEEDEMSEDGSVDLENESEDDLEEEEVEGEAADGGDDAMEVDEKPAGDKPAQQVMA